MKSEYDLAVKQLLNEGIEMFGSAAKEFLGITSIGKDKNIVARFINKVDAITTVYICDDIISKSYDFNLLDLESNLIDDFLISNGLININHCLLIKFNDVNLFILNQNKKVIKLIISLNVIKFD